MTITNWLRTARGNWLCGCDDLEVAKFFIEDASVIAIRGLPLAPPV